VADPFSGVVSVDAGSIAFNDAQQDFDVSLLRGQLFITLSPIGPLVKQSGHRHFLG